MATKVLLVPGFGLPKRVWADEARYVAERAEWIDEVLLTGGNPLGSYEQRAQEILAEVGGHIKPEDRLIIVGYSFGAIIARYIASVGLLRPRYIVTVAGLHRGSPHAEVYVKSSRDRLGPWCLAWMFRRMYKSIAAALGADEEALLQLAPSGMQRFNERYPDADGVSYLSYACVAEQASPPLKIPHLLLSAYTAAPNDGIVTLESAQWGRFMGTVTCDHIEAVGGWGPNHFDSAGFLLALLNGLKPE